MAGKAGAVAHMVNPDFWAGRRVFLTGHTGFKGAWLSLLLGQLGARVDGYALDPPSTPSLYVVAGVADRLATDTRADILDRARLRQCLCAAEPDIVLHLAAQPLVRASYADPVKTFAENVIGTADLLDAVRHAPSVRAVVVVTTDKCYQNKEWVWGYREGDRLGGHDPYSSSKAAAELVTQCFRDSFFSCKTGAARAVAVASVRAGNAIGGGDWAADRLIPDAVRAMDAGESLEIRYPEATRPWQHVLDPLGGYLRLAERLVGDGAPYAQGWNFGPDAASEHSVAEVLDALALRWNQRLTWHRGREPANHEAGLLRLDCSRARRELGWRPRIGFDQALSMTAAWYDRFRAGDGMRDFTDQQIHEFLRPEASCRMH